MKNIRMILLVAFVVGAQSLYGQYYNTGQTPLDTDWRTLRGQQVRVVHPVENEYQARKLLFYMDSVRSSVAFGMRHGTRPTPVVLKNRNFESNGLVMWAPLRIEMLAVPTSDTYSEPWLKQLATHEYRHNVQLNNVNRRFVRFMSILFGQQASILGSGTLPFWFLEGDAVRMETRMSTFGRGLQPSFSMHYRAMGDDMTARRNVDRWFSGSYKEYIPSHYELGYQLVGYAETNCGVQLWDDLVAHSSKWPILITPFKLRMKHRYGLSEPALFRETFSSLAQYWDSLPAVIDSSEHIPTHETSYTRYSHPQFVDDSTLLAVKSDFDRTSRFVLVDIPSGRERVLCHTGVLSSRPDYRDGQVYWTEYRQSLLWEQKVFSQLCTMRIDDRRVHVAPLQRQVLYPTLLPDGGMASVEYDWNGTYSICWNNSRHAFSPDESIHALAYDPSTDALYFIGLSDLGMWIGAVNVATGEESRVTQPVHITISNLRAVSGRLFFGSILSGRDEVHMIDLATMQQTRITSSAFGSFYGIADTTCSRLASTCYDRDGYHLAIEKLTPKETVSATQSLPRNVVNPQRAALDVINVDSVLYTPAENARSVEQRRVTKYRQATHLFSPHSWGLFHYTLDDMGVMGDISPLVSASIQSQNLLSSCQSSVGFCIDTERNNWWVAAVNYNGLPVKLSFEYRISGNSEQMCLNRPEPDTPQYDIPLPTESWKKAQALCFTASMPMILSDGYHFRYLSPSLQYYHTNDYFFNQPTESYLKGYDRMIGAVQFVDNVRMATRDVMPRWGYALKVSAVMNPTNRDFRTSVSLYGRIYTPGIWLHHSLMLRVNRQVKLGDGLYSWTIRDIYPRGAYSTSRNVMNYSCLSADYQMPLCYPDWGFGGLVYFRRLRLNVFGDYASFTRIKYAENPSSSRTVGDMLYSFGATLHLDLNFLRMPSQATTTLSFTTAFPSDSSKPVQMFSLSLPL